MSVQGLSGKVQTVLGPVEPELLGVTLTHEHLLIDLECYFQSPAEASERAWIHAPLTIDRLGGVMRRWRYNLDNMKLLDVQTAVEEASLYKHVGGNSLVDATSIGIARDPLALARIARTTALNIVMGASYYIPPSHPPDMDQRSEEAIADEIIRDITVGVGDTGVRSGIIGEVGNDWPLSDNERKILRASAYAQHRTGAPILIHPGFDPESPLAIMELLVESGADPQHVIMGHLDPFSDYGVLNSLAQTGCYLEWDVFGQEDTSFDTGALRAESLRIPSDVQRLQALEHFIEEGYQDRIVIGHDVCFKARYARYGGKSYDHVLNNIVPRMRKRGLTEEQIRAMLVDNPRSVLTFK